MRVIVNCYNITSIYIVFNACLLGIILSSNSFCGFYIHFFIDDIEQLNCRSPPINTNLKNFVLIGGFFMDKNPKRRKYQDNPYTLTKDESKNLYIISFKDSSGVMQEVKITKDVWDVFDKYEKIDLSQMNEFDNHIEHSEIYEESLVKRAKEKPLSVEDEVIKDCMFGDVRNAVDELPEIQGRRVKKYYFENKTYEQIAQEEHCTKRAVKSSVDIAIRKIYKKLTN